MITPTVMDRARATIVLDHPFFASILLRHPMQQDKSIKTCCINGRTGVIRYNPAFVEPLTTKQAVYLLCHEVLHYVGLDTMRVGSRDKKKWNHVADEWINDMLAKLSIGEPIPGGANRPGASESTREALYEMLPPDDGQKPKDPGGEPGDGEGDNPGNKPGGEPGDTPSDGPGNGQDGDPMGGDMEYDDKPLTDSEKSEKEAEIKLEVAEAAQSAKMRGNMPAALQKLVAEVIDVKTPWFDILERHMTDRVQNDTSWARPNRRYAPDFYLPVIDGIGALGEIVIQVDISGSVSRQEIAHYNGHLKRIIEQCNPTKVHVIYTDTEVQKHEEFDKPEDVEIVFYSGGGTRMEAGIEYIEAKGIEPAVMVTLTDGYDSYCNPAPGFPVVWCVSSNKVPPYGDTIPFDMNAGMAA